MIILAIDTSTAACTAALFDGERCVAQADELIGRGHAERLAPMLEALLDGRRADTVLVGVGPGSFTGIRVGLAAASGLAIGWDSQLVGLSSLALLAASARSSGDVAAAMIGGHGELFVQQFDRGLRPTGELLNLPPDRAAAEVGADLVVGPGAQPLVAARGRGKAIEGWPTASLALKLPVPLRTLPAAPVYARAPDATARTAA